MACHSGAAQRGEPGIHERVPLQYGFRVCTSGHAGMTMGVFGMPLTQELGRFVAGLTFEKLPGEAVETARTGIIDTIATMIAGAHDPAPQLLRTTLAPAPAFASLYFSGESAHAPEAAWI